MHFPQLPDEEGWDVNATWSTNQMALADDWQCSQTGLITDIHFWGSWRDMNGDGSGDVGVIDSFLISIHADIPAGTGGIPYSRPGTALRLWNITRFTAIRLAPPTLGAWYDPFTGLVVPNDHQEYFQYNIKDIPSLVPNPFTQEQGTIYWLRISALVQDWVHTEWGWKSSRDHYQDDAVRGQGTVPPTWTDMYEPPRTNMFQMSIDPLGFFSGGGGTNAYGEGWYFYPDTGWWNIWFYDNPFTMEHYKRTVIPPFFVQPLYPGQPANIVLALNWSTPAWSLEGNPPGESRRPPIPPTDEAQNIQRWIFWMGVIPPTGVYVEPPEYIIPYNPEWVSIDVTGVNFETTGFISHECVRTSLDLAFVITGPEPCPLPTVNPWCTTLQPRDCASTNPLSEVCLPRQASFDATGNPIIELCDCFSTTAGCGPVDIQPNATIGYTVSCPGPCPTPEVCELHFDGNPTGMNSIDSSAIPPGALVTCKCVAQPEACCFVDGHCEMLLAANCLLIEGTPQGPGTTCSLLQEACCLPNGTCRMTDPLCCDDLGGTSMGPGSQCTAPEACCFAPPNPFCIEMDPLCCVLQGGTPGGAGSTCTPEACCMPDGTCSMVAACLCELLGGKPQGTGTQCTAAVACCMPSGSCLDVDPLCCDEMGGVPQGPGNCSVTTCTPATQACCLANGTCKEIEYNRCVALGGDPQGPGSICPMPLDRCDPLKWSQPPTYGPVITQPPCFWGWDDVSDYFSGPIVADDWACNTDQPVTDIHWWGSYQNWTTREPPQPGMGPVGFHIGIWTDVPRNADRPFSHPKTMIWQWMVPRDATNERWVGCDEYPGMPSDTCFRYDFTIPQEEWFYQAPVSDPTIYWISISAVNLGPQQQYPWGWKTREHFFNDDAVRILNPVAPGVGASFVDGLPIETPDGKSWDMAFVLTTISPGPSKWNQWPNPDLPGLHAHDGITLADNWECAGGKVTDLHWWGNYELGDLGQEERGAGIQCINLSIHANNPTTPWCLPQDPAPWGVCALFSALNEHDTGMVNSEGSKIYEYTFYLNPGWPQTPGDIYWLDIEAQSTNPQNPALWRWQENDRTSVPRLCPAAQRSMPPPPFMWSSIQWPDDPPLYSEMAFRVTSRPYPPDQDPTGLAKSRFISFSVPAGSGSTALRVKLTSLHHVMPLYTDGASIPFTLFEGQSMYVGPPSQYVESGSDPTQFMASNLQCDPYYQDWSTVGLLAVTGEAIVPSSSYDVENLAFACLGLETTAPCLSGGANVSAALTIKTARSGDVVAAFQDPNLAASQPDFDDIGALVNKFKSLLGAPIKAHAKLYGVDARGLMDLSPDVGFDDISLDVDAFKGKPYPYKPGKCTGFPGMACIADADCGINGPCILCP
jgi:hypothetical protein